MKRKLNLNKIIKLIILLVIIILVGIGIYIAITKLSEDKEPQDKIEVIDNIKDYQLDDNETDYYKTLFANLKKVLNTDEVNEEEYARLISQLFLTDFFTLDNKLNKNDIGGTQFIYEPFRTDFEKKARDTIYHSIENNLYGDREQELPVVHSVDVSNLNQDSYEYSEQLDENAFYIDLIIRYEENLGYQEEVSLVIVHNNEKLEIVKMN